MKARLLVLCGLLGAAASAHAGSLSYAQCGTYDAYLLIYKTTERFEELGKLRCGEKVEVLSHSGGYSHILTLDGRLGWVRDADLADTPPPPQRTFTFGLSEPSKDVRPTPVPKSSISALTNDDILAMNGQRRGFELILKKINSTRCAFDTSPEALRRLHASGVSDKVILAMLEVPVASETSDRKSPDTVEVKIPNGTPIEIELHGNVSSEEAQEGTIVEMSAAEDLVVDGIPVVLRGSAARARILAVKQPGSHGGSGEVAWFMQDIVAISGDHVPVTFASKQPGNNRTRNFEGYPFFLSEFREGSPAIKASDKRFRVVIHGDMVLSVSQSLAAGLPTPNPETPSVRQIATQPAVRPDAAPPSQSSALDGVKP